MQIALFGTCAESGWRKYVMDIVEMAGIGNIEWFNPDIGNDVEWTEDHQRAEMEARDNCDLLLMVFTPKAMGYLAVAELVEASIVPEKRKKLVACIIDNDDGHEFDDWQITSIDAVKRMCIGYGAHFVRDLDDLLPVIVEAKNQMPDFDTEGIKIFNPNVIECTVERDGPTYMVLDRRQYTFDKNALGHYTCHVPSAAAVSALLRQPQNFRRYCPTGCRITPEEKDRYNIFMNDEEFEDFWNGFVDKFADLSSETFIGVHEVLTQDRGDARHPRKPDEFQHIPGFVDKNLQKLNDAPEWVRRRARIKWAQACTDTGVERKYPGAT